MDISEKVDCTEECCEKELQKPKFFQLRFNPKPDITVFELAKACSLNIELMTIPIPLSDKAIEAIPEELIRHYDQIDVTEEFTERFLQAEAEEN